MVETTKGGNVALKALRVPDSVQPSDLFGVEATAENHAGYIGPFDDDRCGTAPPGYRIKAEIETPSGAIIETAPECITNTDLPGADHTFTADVAAPESEGRHEVRARLVLPGSGKSTAWVSQSLQVHKDAPEEPEIDDGGDGGSSGSEWYNWGPGGGGSGGGSGGGDPFNLGLSQQATLALVVVALLAIAWLADSTVGVLD